MHYDNAIEERQKQLLDALGAYVDSIENTGARVRALYLSGPAWALWQLMDRPGHRWFRATYFRNIPVRTRGHHAGR